MATKTRKSGPYRSVEELKARFFPKMQAKSETKAQEDPGVMATALADDLAKRLRRALT